MCDTVVQDGTNVECANLVLAQELSEGLDKRDLYSQVRFSENNSSFAPLFIAVHTGICSGIYKGTDIAYCAICGQDIKYTYLIHRLSARIAILVILVPKVLILCEAGPRPLVPSILILLRD